MRHKNHCWFLALAIMFTWTQPATSWMDTAELHSVCEAGLHHPSPDNPRYAMCTGLMLGMLTADLLETNIICVPTDLDTKAALALFIARASREKDKDIEGTVTMFRSLAEKYPCARKRP
jgi:hypothetical protein